jgi:hypothetical protein
MALVKKAAPKTEVESTTSNADSGQSYANATEGEISNEMTLEEIKAQAKAEALAEAKAEALAEAKAEALAEAKAEAKAEADKAAKDEAGKAVKATAEKSDEEGKAAKAAAKAEALAEAKAAAKAEALAEAKAQAKAEALAEAKAEAKAAAKAELAAEAAAQSAAEAAAQSAAAAEKTETVVEKTETVVDDAPEMTFEEMKAQAKAEALAELKAEAASTAVATFEGAKAHNVVATTVKKTAVDTIGQAANQGFGGVALGFGSFPLVKLPSEGIFQSSDDEDLGKHIRARLQESRNAYLYKQEDNNDSPIAYSYDGVNLTAYSGDEEYKTVEELRAAWEEEGAEMEVKTYVEVIAIVEVGHESFIEGGEVPEALSDIEGEPVIFSIAPNSVKAFGGKIATLSWSDTPIQGALMDFKVGAKRKQGGNSYYPWKFKLVK